MSSRKRCPRINRDDTGNREIRRLWGDMEVVDAIRDLPVIMSAEDVKGAVRKDPAGCAFARACRRLYGSAKVLFFRRVAYVDLPDKKGQRRVERFQLTPEMRQLVEEFDRGRRDIPPGGFLLKKPRFSDRLEYKRVKSLGRRGGHARRLAGTAVKPSARKPVIPYRDGPLVIDLVRSGQGAVQFRRRTGNPIVDPLPVTPKRADP